MVLRQKMRSAALMLAKVARSRSDSSGLGTPYARLTSSRLQRRPRMKSMSRWLRPRVRMSLMKLATAGRRAFCGPR